MYQHVMVPLDGSELAECVLPHAEKIALGCEVVNVSVVLVVEPLHLRGGIESRFPPEELQRVEAESVAIARDYLEKKVKSLKDAGVAAKSVVLRGKVVDTLMDYANENGVDLIIISTHGRSGVSRWVWGSITDRILHSACVPITMVRAPGCVVGI